MKSVVISTLKASPAFAAEDIVTQLRKELPSPDVLLVFTAGWFEPQLVVKTLHEVFACPLIGYSTNGIADQASSSLDSSVMVVGISSKDIQFETGVVRNLSKKIEFQELLLPTNCIQNKPDLCLLFPDNLTVSITDIVRQFQASLGNTPIVGGSPGDEWAFKRTYQFFGGEVLTDSAVYLLIRGNITYSVGVGEGWEPFGEEHTITKSEGRAVYQIGKHRAYDFYRNVIDDPNLFGEFPLQMQLNSTSVLRAPLSSNPEIGSIHFGADVPEGCRVRLTRSSRANILEGTKQSVLTATKNFHDNSNLSLIFSCAARRHHLGVRVMEERDAILNHVQTPLALTYVYGEIAPLQKGGQTLPLNETIVTLILGTRHEQ